MATSRYDGSGYVGTPIRTDFKQQPQAEVAKQIQQYLGNNKLYPSEIESWKDSLKREVVCVFRFMPGVWQKRYTVLEVSENADKATVTLRGNSWKNITITDTIEEILSFLDEKKASTGSGLTQCIMQVMNARLSALETHYDVA